MEGDFERFHIFYNNYNRLLFMDNTDADLKNIEEVERQTELMYKAGTIWTAIYNADKGAIDKLIDDNPKVIYERGAVGECPIHLLFLQSTNQHLLIAQDLITRFPKIVTQVYNKPVNKYIYKTNFLII